MNDTTDHTHAHIEKTPPAGPPRVWSGWDVLLIGLAALALIVAGTLILRFALGLGEGAGDPSIGQTLLLASLEVVGLLASIFLLGVVRRRLSLQALGLRPTLWWWLAVAAGVSFLLLPVRAGIGLLVQLVVGTPTEELEALSDFLVPQDLTWWGALILFFLVAVAIPFAEELFFRGVVFAWLRHRVGLWAGVLISALLFGVAHGQPAVIASNFILGVALALLYERSGSLWPAFALHAVNNGTAMLLLFMVLLLQRFAGVSI